MSDRICSRVSGERYELAGEVPRTDARYPSVNVLGINVSAVNMASALETIERWLRERERHYVCVTNVHSVMETRRDPALQAIFNAAGMVTPDGMPLVWFSRLNGQRHVRRVYGPDLLLACCERLIASGCRHFFYGGADGVAELLARRLQGIFPGLRVAGVFAPPFRPLSRAEDDAIVKLINESGAGIVWVGLGAPKQERWMSEHAGRILAPVMVGVGAAFDFHAGVKRQAPRWMQRSGLEWLFRLSTEPRRLWRRYLILNPRFIWNVGLQAIGLRRFDPAS